MAKNKKKLIDWGWMKNATHLMDKIVNRCNHGSWFILAMNNNLNIKWKHNIGMVFLPMVMKHSSKNLKTFYSHFPFVGSKKTFPNGFVCTSTCWSLILICVTSIVLLSTFPWHDVAFWFILSLHDKLGVLLKKCSFNCHHVIK